MTGKLRGLEDIENLVFNDLTSFNPYQGHITYCGRRATLTPADAMGALRKELVDTLGKEAAKVILTRYGYSCGHEDAIHFARDSGLNFPDPRLVVVGPQLHMFQGIAEVISKKLEIDDATGHYLMEGQWNNSYEAEQHLRLFGQDDDPVCWTLTGYASGFSSQAFGTQMICLEEKCLGRGDDHCAWSLVPADKLGPEHDEILKHFTPLNIKDQLNLLEQKVQDRTSRLEASETRYRDMIEDLPEMVFALDDEGQLLQLNGAGRRTVGIDKDKLYDINITDLVSRKQRRKALNYFKRISKETETTQFETVFAAADGREFPAELTITPVRKSGKNIGYRGLAMDITSRHEREKELTDKANRQAVREQQTLERINDAMFVADLKGKFTYINGRMAKLLDIEPEKAQGRRFSDFMPESSATSLQNDINQRLKGEPPHPFQVTVSGGEETQRVFEVSTSLLLDDDTPFAVIGFARDISRRRELEAQLAQSSRLAALGQFASGIAHEINNPMGLISGYAEDLLDVLADKPDGLNGDELADLKQNLQTIQDQAYRSKYITSNLLSFARKRTIYPEPTNLVETVQERVDFLLESGKYNSQGINVQAEPNLPFLMTDPFLCGQVILNLLKNADDAMEGTGFVNVRIYRTPGHIEVEIADQGTGLKPDVMEKIFDPFFTTKAPGQGTGLGLSICYGIVGELGGSITCGNQPEGGAWFRVSLPLEHSSIEGEDQ
jgi:PAS domain S-box-containing protein